MNLSIYYYSFQQRLTNFVRGLYDKFIDLVIVLFDFWFLWHLQKIILNMPVT